MVMRSSAREIQAGALSLLLGVLFGLFMIPVPLHANPALLNFPAANYTLDDTYGFLTYWNEHDGERTLGTPVTEVLEENGLPVQYFERGRLEYHLELEGTPVLRGRIGADYAEALWRVFAPPPPRLSRTDTQLFEATGHTLGEPFLGFWNNNGGLEIFGYPISEPVWEYVGDKMLRVQYFERGRLEQHHLASGTPDEVRISSLGHDLALVRGLITPGATPEPVAEEELAAPVEEFVAPVYEEEYVEPVYAEEYVEPIYAEESVATGYVPTGGGKSIVVNISQQWLYAYEGDILVFDAPITTGRDGFNTPAGSFAIYAKVPVQTMSGTLGGEYYSVPNVPHAMYINGGVALHGTYWHNLFGSGIRISHGCINLPLGSAAWIYDWAPVGTPVQVTY